MHRDVDLAITALDSFIVTKMLRAVDLTIRHNPSTRLPITSDILKDIVAAAPVLGSLAPAFKFAVIAAYYGFLRQSNLAPHSPNSFNPREHTCRGDVVLHPPGLVIILKWSKTMQRGESAHLVPLPQRPSHPLCPLSAFHDMIQVAATLSPNHPLLQLPGQAKSSLRERPLPPTQVVTVPHLTEALKRALLHIGRDPHRYSLHSLRAGGATDAHRAGASPLDIKQHGAWASHCFNRYLAPPSPKDAEIPKLLSKS